MIDGVAAYIQESSSKKSLQDEFVTVWLFETIEILSALIPQLSDAQRTKLDALKQELQEFAREIGATKQGE